MNPIAVWKNLRKRLDLVHSFQLQDSDLVLDIGSGQNPNLRANVLCDRFAADSTERNQASLVVDRPMVLGEAENLPFQDRAFDFVICSHLLEHVENPDVVCRELMRVAKRGYIETPHRIWEKLHSYPFHRWYVKVTEGVLEFEEKGSLLHDAELRDWTERQLGTSPVSSLFEQEFSNLGLLARLWWQGTISVRVLRLPDSIPNPFVKSVNAAQEVVHSTDSQESLGTKIFRWIGRRMRRASDRRVGGLQDLLNLCRCPDCKGHDLTLRDQRIRCGSCRRTFPLMISGPQEVPALLPGVELEA